MHPHPLCRWVLLAAGVALLALGASRAFATSIIFATFSQPVLGEDRLFVSSPDKRRLLAIRIEGGLAWTREFEEITGFAKLPGGDLRVATAGRVYSLNPRTGETLSDTALPAPRGGMTHVAEGGLLVFYHADWKIAQLLLLDAVTGRVLREESDAERVAYANADRVVFLKSRRDWNGAGYTFTKTWLEARARDDWRSLWTLDFTESKEPWSDVAKVGAELLVTDGLSLHVVDLATGASRRVTMPETPASEKNSWSRLSLDQGRPYYLRHKFPRSMDFDATVHRLHWCEPTALAETGTVDLRASEISRVARHGDYLIADSLYRTRGYRTDGGILWEYFQMHRTEAVANRFSSPTKLSVKPTRLSPASAAWTYRLAG